jgi:hypothetical protein
MNNLESLRFPRTRVTSSHLSFSAAHPLCVEALNLITSSTDARLVISSTWRGLGLKVLREIFRCWGITGVSAGRTPDLSRGYRNSPLWESPERGEEIKAWLNQHPEVESFIILDDGNDMGDLRHRLVQTDYEAGLTMADAVRAVTLLNGSIDSLATS